MRVPIRKAGKYTNLKPDFNITQEKFAECKQNLERLKKQVRPKLSSEVKLLSEGGDFSENAGYQMAKGRLRGLNNKIDKLEEIIKYANIIPDNLANDSVQLGSFVTIQSIKNTKTYQILGPTETDPLKGIISHKSPLGSALMDKKAGQIVQVENNGKIAEYKILKVE